MSADVLPSRTFCTISGEFSYPSWYIQKGDRMRIFWERADSVRLTSRSAQVLIVRDFSEFQQHTVSWRITHTVGKCHGSILYDTSNVLLAFGVRQVREGESACATWPYRWGADVGKPGFYIRQGPFLNIPMPGTGSQGDPNVSILLSDGIVNAVANVFNEPLPQVG